MTYMLTTKSNLMLMGEGIFVYSLHCVLEINSQINRKKAIHVNGVPWDMKWKDNAYLNTDWYLETSIRFSQAEVWGDAGRLGKNKCFWRKSENILKKWVLDVGKSVWAWRGGCSVSFCGNRSSWLGQLPGRGSQASVENLCFVYQEKLRERFFPYLFLPKHL